VLAALKSDEPGIRLLSAKVYAAASDDAEAEKALRRDIVVDPLNVEAFTILGQLLARKGTLDAARAEFDVISRSDPQSVSAKLMTALIAHVQGDVKAAKTGYSEVLKLEPRTALAANNLAALYSEERESLDLAQQLAESASDQLPTNADVQDTLGWVYYQRHLLGQAIRQFERSIAADPGKAVYHYHLGLAHSKNGEPARARRAFEAALKLDPKFTDAHQALATVPN
jgi:Tfp pilus assembly protein PilF